MTSASGSSRSLVAVLLCGFSAVTCSRDRGRVPSPSAATEPASVIHSAKPVWSKAERWRLADPILAASETAAGMRRDGFRHVAGALALEDGLVVLSDRALGEIRYLSLDGTTRSAIGRHGKGQGEFARSTDLSLFSGGSPGAVLVGDSGNRRVHTIGPKGSSITSTPLEEGRLAGVFSDGTWLVKLVGSSPPTKRPGPVDYKVEYKRYGTNGRPLGLIATTGAPGRFMNTAGRMSDYLIPFVPQPSAVAVGNRLWVVHGTDSVADGYSLDGTLSLRHRWNLLRRATVDAKARVERSFVRMPEADRGVLETLDMPDLLPAYRTVLADDKGNLWIERYRLPWERNSQPTWDVIEPARGWLGSVDAPPGFEVVHISNDMVLGLVQDEQGAIRLRGYRLLK